VILWLTAGLAVLSAVLLSLTSFDLPFNPKNNQQTLFFDALSVVIFLLFVALSFVLLRNLVKLSVERRLGVLGSKFRARLVAASLLLSFLPVIVMFWFAYVLMNRSIDKWFSTPVQEVRQDTSTMASLLSRYAAQNAHAEALTIASSAETQRAFQVHDFGPVLAEFKRHRPTLQGGFALAVRSDQVQASFGLPAAWEQLQSAIPLKQLSEGNPTRFTWGQTEYILAGAPVNSQGSIIVAMPLPDQFSTAVKQLESSQQRYLDLYRERRSMRRTYMGLLLLLTVLVLFATTWLALFLSKLVTRPVAALAEATQEISRGRLDYRVDVAAADEIGDLVRSFNQMAEELESNRTQIENSTRELADANIALQQRRTQIETILESIPNGVLSLNAERRIAHVNQAFLRLFRPGDENQPLETLVGASMAGAFPQEMLQEIEPLLRRAERMGITTIQMQQTVQRTTLNVAVTAAILQHQGRRLGYVLVFEDLSDLLKAQKQAAWREVARRVAHEIKNPLTPISLSAERIRRHLQRGSAPDANSLRIIQNCADTIASAVETVRTLVDEFSTLARFPTARPEPADVNLIVTSTLAMFDSRLEGIQVRTSLSNDLPKVMADAEAMKRALANLMDNAAEAMQGASFCEISISTMLVSSGEAVEIVVADTGHGVTQEAKERLFLPYFSTKQRGTGLGLAIVSRIIEDHRGSIRVEENKPTGTRFIIELPTVAQAVETINQHA